jgi:hypothetical protein
MAMPIFGVTGCHEAQPPLAALYDAPSVDNQNPLGDRSIQPTRFWTGKRDVSGRIAPNEAIALDNNYFSRPHQQNGLKAHALTEIK